LGYALGALVSKHPAGSGQRPPFLVAHACAEQTAATATATGSLSPCFRRRRPNMPPPFVDPGHPGPAVAQYPPVRPASSSTGA
jgi:hypothetical protein